MTKKYIFILPLIGFVFVAKSQENLSLYSLKDYVVQAQNTTPIFLPKNSFSFGTPVNLNADIYSAIKLNDFFVENGDLLTLDFNKLNEAAQNENILSSSLNVNILTLAFKTKRGSISAFANLKGSINWLYSDDLTDIIANGLQNNIKLSQEKMAVTAYNEIGIGITRNFLMDKLVVGLRLKLLNGIAHVQIADDAFFSLDVNPNNLYWTVGATNATAYSSGIQGIESIFTANKGFGFDIGARYAIDKKLSVEFSVNDIGSISWSENVTNYNIADTNGSEFTGIDLNTDEDILTEIESAVNDVIGTNETDSSFDTKLATRTYISATYKITQKNHLTASYFTESNFLNISPSISFGLNRKLKNSTFGILAITGGVENKVRLGANFAVRLAFFQLYAATDNLSSFSGGIEDNNSGNISFGVNFLFGNKSSK